MNKDQQSKLRQAILEKLVEKEAEEKKAVAPLTEQKKPEAPLTGTEKYAQTLREQVSKDNRNRQKVIPEKTDLLAGDESVTAAQLRQSNQELWNRVQSSMASLGGGGVGPAELKELVTGDFVDQNGDTMTGHLYAPAFHVTQDADNSNKTILYYETSDSTHTLEALDGEGTDFDHDWMPSRLPRRGEYAGLYYLEQGDSSWFYSGSLSGGVIRSEDARTWEDWEVFPDSWYIGHIVSDETGATWVGIKSGYGGGTSKLAWSTDSGQTWNRKNEGYSGLTQYAYWHDIAYGNGKFIVAGSKQTQSSSYKPFRKSTDGYNWSDVGGEYGDSGLTSVTWSEENGRFVATKGQGSWHYGFPSILWSEDGDTWNGVTFTDSANYGLNDAAFGEGVWVAVGPSGKILYSANNGAEWTRTSFREDYPDIDSSELQFANVEYSNGYFVAKADVSGRGAYSTDGINWKPFQSRGMVGYWKDMLAAEDKILLARDGRIAYVDIVDETDGSLTFDGQLVATKDNLEPLITKVMELDEQIIPSLEERAGEPIDFDAWVSYSSADDTIGWSSIAYGDGKYVSVAGGYFDANNKKKVMYSTDGVNWTSASSSRDGNKWSDITYGDGKFVAVSSNGSNKTMYSSDGVTWTGVVSAYEGGTWYSVAYGDDKFVAVSGNGNENQKVMYSSDATSWTLGSIPANEASLQMTAVAYADGVWVAVANGGVSGAHRAIYSTDGITWTAGSGLPSMRNMSGLAYGDGKFVAAGSSGFIAYSTDGITWSTDGVSGPIGVTIDYQTVVYENDTWLALGERGAAYSEDGLTWTKAKTPDDLKRWVDVVYADNKYVAVAGGFNAYTSPVAVLETSQYKQSGLYWNEALVATEENLEPLIDKVNELSNVPSVIYQDSDPFLVDSIYAANTYSNGQLWFNSSTPAGQMTIRHNDSWVAI